MHQQVVWEQLVLLALVMGAGGMSFAAGSARTVFSCRPAEGKARTAGGEVEFCLARGARRIDCPAGKAVSPGADGRIGHADVRLGAIPATGTVSFWLKLSRRIQVCPRGGRVSARILHCEDLTVFLRENENGVSVNVEGGNEIRRPRVRGLASFDLTHLRADQWYHLALRYDAPKGTWRLILNGVLQPEPWFFGPFRFRNLTKRVELNGLMRSDSGRGEPARVALGPVAWRAGAAEPEEILAELKAVKGWKIPPNRGEGVLEKVESFDGEALGGRVLYENAFDEPLAKDEWVLEGSTARVQVKDGRLHIHNTKDCVLWLKRKLPRDFVAAWDVQPGQIDGLTIVFFSAMGADGRDLFDPALARRDGGFNQYIRGDIRCYHCSYYAGRRGSANMRKNPGFYMVGMGPDLVGSRMMAGETGPFRVVLVRRGGRMECAIDGKRFLLFEDDGKTYGPIHGGGYFGLRQMFHSRRVAYDNLVIREVRETP